MASTPDVGQGAVHPRLIDLFLNVVGSPLMIKEFGRGTKQGANRGPSESRIPDAPVQVEILEDFRPQQPCGSGGSDWGCVGAVRRRGRGGYRLDGAPQTRWSPAMEAGSVFDGQLRGCVVRELCAFQKRSGWFFWYLTVLKAHGN